MPGVGEVMGSILGPNYVIAKVEPTAAMSDWLYVIVSAFAPNHVIAKDVKSCTYCTMSDARH